MANLLSNKQADISIMRIVATLAVIFLHTCNTLANNAEAFHLTVSQQLFFNCGYSLMNWSVPLFFMMTGALLLGKDHKITIRICICKYVKRMILALVIFGVPFSWIEIFSIKRVFSLASIILGFQNIFTGDSWGHLWYLYAIIAVYLVLPVLKAFTDTCTRKELRSMIIVLSIFDLWIPIIKAFTGIEIAFSVAIGAYSVFYLFLGKYLIDGIPHLLNNRKIVGVLLGISASCVVGMNFFLYPNATAYVGYNSPVIALISSLVFILLRGTVVSSRHVDLLWSIDRLCFGAYLIHPVFTNFVYKFLHFTPLSFGICYPIAVIVFWFVFAFCGFGLSKLLSYIMPLKKYVL